jgi:hypothetical protein
MKAKRSDAYLFCCCVACVLTFVGWWGCMYWPVSEQSGFPFVVGCVVSCPAVSCFS